MEPETKEVPAVLQEIGDDAPAKLGCAAGVIPRSGGDNSESGTKEYPDSSRLNGGELEGKLDRGAAEFLPQTGETRPAEWAS